METSQTVNSAVKQFAEEMKMPVEKVIEMATRHSYYVLALDCIKLVVTTIGLCIFGWLFFWAKKRMGSSVTLWNYPVRPEILMVVGTVGMIILGVVALFLLQDVASRVINPEWMAFSDLIGLVK